MANIMKQLALLGCAHIHTPGFIKTMLKRSSDVKVKSVWDHDAARGQQRADELGARYLGDVDTILSDPEIAAVVICSETDRHEQLVLAAAGKKKDLFVEKPLAMGARDAYAMADAIERAGVLYQTGYFLRGGPIHNYLREILAARKLGKITRVRGSNCHSGALGGWFDTEWRWMADPKIAGCGAFGDLGTHSLDILLWLFGPITECTALLDNGTAHYPNCEETGEGLMRFKSGVIGTLAAAWDDVANPVMLLISGTEGHATMIEQKLYLTCKNIEGADGKAPWTKLPEPRSAGFDAFIDAISGKDRSKLALVPVREAAYRSAVMEAMYEGARHKKWVAPKER
jgi:predicted dehydrogenase